jgi:hypothetical protein
MTKKINKNQFWEINYTYDDDIHHRIYGFHGNNGQNKEDVINDLHGMHPGKITILNSILMEISSDRTCYYEVENI